MACAAIQVENDCAISEPYSPHVLRSRVQMLVCRVSSATRSRVCRVFWSRNRQAGRLAEPSACFHSISCLAQNFSCASVQCSAVRACVRAGTRAPEEWFLSSFLAPNLRLLRQQCADIATPTLFFFVQVLQTTPSHVEFLLLFLVLISTRHAILSSFGCRETADLSFII